MMGPGGSFGAGGSANKPILDADGKEIPSELPAPRCDFVVQFAWKPRFEKEGGKEMKGGMPAPEASGDATATEDTGSATGAAAAPSGQENQMQENPEN